MPELLAAVTFKHEPFPLDERLNPVEQVVQADAEVHIAQLAAQAVQLDGKAKKLPAEA